MIDALGKGTVLGYCGNVHPVRTFDDLLAVIRGPAKAVRDAVGADIGYGLWMPADVLAQVTDDDAKELRDAMGESGLVPYTFNAFPYGDFHGEVVKTRVYEPAWDDPRRSEFTLNAARLLARLVPEGAEGSISTLPIGWGPLRDALVDGRAIAAADALRDLSQSLDRIESETGRSIRVGLEPEPGCALQSASDVETFFRGPLSQRPGSERVHNRIGVCHDVCHSAVMGESQSGALLAYKNAGVRCVKLQISSAPRTRSGVSGHGTRTADLAEARRSIAAFTEGRYLHQTVVGGRFFEDLPDALASDAESRDWRVHFHIPVYRATVGSCGTTRREIHEAIRATLEHHDTTHYEIETYAWGVLPESERGPSLEAGIAWEFRWVESEARPRSLGSLAGAWVRLGRLGNLPTVWSNCVAGAVLAFPEPAPSSIANACLAGTLFYTSGMVLNDARDAEIDAEERPDRPIPSGDVARGEAWGVGLCLGLCGLALAMVATGEPISGLIIGGGIAAYTVLHKSFAWAFVFMALCRAALYPMAAGSAGDPNASVWALAAVVFVYVSGLTLYARSEAISAAVRKRVPILVAAIALVDATALFGFGHLEAAAVCAGLFVLTLVAQRWIPGS